ncbi:MAG: hypothetical protein ACM3VZ_01375 [Acidobacteriota bacterium]
MSYELIWEPRGVIKRYFGVLTSRDLIEPVERTESDPRFDNLRYVINDFVAVDGLDLGPFDVDHVAAVDHAAAKTNDNIWIAVVTTSSDVIALVERYAELSRNAFPTRIFDTMTQARSWLADR